MNWKLKMFIPIFGLITFLRYCVPTEETIEDHNVLLLLFCAIYQALCYAMLALFIVVYLISVYLGV